MMQIKNLNNYSPKKGERYLVDTNVWYWFTYVSSKEMKVIDVPQKYQMSDYPAFIEKTLNSESELFHCALNLAELAGSIERSEFKIFQAVKQDTQATKKMYRQMPAERSGVLNEIYLAWDTIEALSTCLEITLNNSSVEKSKNLLKQSNLDSYDSFYVQLMELNGITNIITDDGDFSSLKGCTVYTANKRMLNT
jgi:predicted nucleic acid-binding protein